MTFVCYFTLNAGLVGTRVLSKEPRGKDVDAERDVFSVNLDFANKLFRIKINTIQVSVCVYGGAVPTLSNVMWIWC